MLSLKKRHTCTYRWMLALIDDGIQVKVHELFIYVCWKECNYAICFFFILIWNLIFEIFQLIEILSSVLRYKLTCVSMTNRSTILG